LFGSGALTKRSRSAPDADRRIAAYLIGRGNAARDAREWSRAALWYEEALLLVPRRADIHIQRGHMLKEAGAFDAAEQAYADAHQLTPDDPDLALQLGHFYKVAGRRDDASQSYQRALVLKPGWDQAERELLELRDNPPESVSAAAAIDEPLPRDLDEALRQAAAGLARPAEIAALVPELAPRKPHEMVRAHGEGIDLRWMGRHERGFWGVLRTVRGVEAVRGFCISGVPIEEAQMLLDGRVFYRGPVRGGYPLRNEAVNDSLLKYVFNIWHDFAAFDRGRHAFELRLIDAEGETRSFHDTIVIADPLSEADFPDSDALVEITDPDPRSLERRIRARASMVRPAKRDLLPHRPRAILVQRTDQLGDMVASIPAMQRLRALYPDAQFVGLLTAANADIARSLSLFDEVLVIDFPDDKEERRRLMPLDQQEALRERLKPYNFDMAIDLAQASVSRDLLPLSGAPFLYGVAGGGFGWLSASFGLDTHDRLNRLDRVPHSRKTLALIETLGAIGRDSFEVIRRPDLDRTTLETYGLTTSDRYAVLHMGARVEFSRWPYFPELAAILLAQTDLKIVMMTEDRAIRETLPPELTESPRFQLLDERLSFDAFDTFVSFATLLVGNDSGPKHLAALRGTSVVTLHTARINWMEWGQEGIGSIVSRRVPCAGCAIFHDAEECGKDFACIRDIRPAEVFEAVKAYV
jgi:ADP-heptose:LPS heptosyltransferase